jgi:hypothetical protein
LRDGAQLDVVVRCLIEYPEVDSLFAVRPGVRERLCSAAREVADAAFSRGEPQSLEIAHATLAQLYEQYFLTPGSGRQLGNQFSPTLLEVRLALEKPWERYERGRCRDWGRIDPAEFMPAYRELVSGHRASQHALSDFLGDEAGRDSICRYIAADGALGLGFVDLIAVTLVGEDNQRVKREVVDTLGDEVGGTKMHTVLNVGALSAVGAASDSTELAAGLGWRGMAGINLFHLLCINRQFRNEYIGAMGITDYVDPPHHAKVVRGCRRVGLDDNVVDLYSTYLAPEDLPRSNWPENVVAPTAKRRSDSAAAVLMGAEMRLNTCADYYDETLERLLADDTGQ